MVLTHTDSDHIGGADIVVSNFEIDQILMADYKKDNNTYRDLLNAMASKNYEYYTPEVGAEYSLGDAEFMIIAPNEKYDDPNNYGIALVLRNGENSFLFSGDCEDIAEADIVANKLDIDIDVYQVGHHGSRTSSSIEFLNAMTPVYGVISCEEGNSYGHPHAATLNSLRMMGVKVFRTDEQGSIIAFSDGETITWNCAPTDSWQAGEPTQNSSSSSNTNSSSSSNKNSYEVQTSTSKYAVNMKNGKIHKIGACVATKDDEGALEQAAYFDTYAAAEKYSKGIAPFEEKRKCGNCW